MRSLLMMVSNFSRRSCGKALFHIKAITPQLFNEPRQMSNHLSERTTLSVDSNFIHHKYKLYNLSACSFYVRKVQLPSALLFVIFLAL
uniref:Uncharacterized protein n=1 Tax=Octopus bimaculoides TaxID=37653 RepID=A0A0L8G468_OCTBM